MGQVGFAAMPPAVLQGQAADVPFSHVGMSVNLDAYRALARILDQEAERWTS